MDSTDKELLTELDSYVAQIPALKETRAFSDTHTRWVANVLAFLESNLGKQHRLYKSFAHLSWHKDGSFVVSPLDEGTYNYNEATDRIHHRAYLSQLDTAKGFLESAGDLVKKYGAKKIFEGANSPKETSSIITIIELGERKLRKLFRAKPENEKQVQEKFEDLLIAHDIKFTREAERISYSSKTYIPDFVFPDIDTIVEFKLCSSVTKEKELISEINDDIVAYRTKYPNLIFLVYDLGFIRDADKFIGDIQAHDSVILKVIKH